MWAGRFLGVREIKIDPDYEKNAFLIGKTFHTDTT
jgi:hypothetical protein